MWKKSFRVRDGGGVSAVHFVSEPSDGPTAIEAPRERTPPVKGGQTAPQIPLVHAVNALKDKNDQLLGKLQFLRATPPAQSVNLRLKQQLTDTNTTIEKLQKLFAEAGSFNDVVALKGSDSIEDLETQVQTTMAQHDDGTTRLTTGGRRGQLCVGDA